MIKIKDKTGFNRRETRGNWFFKDPILKIFNRSVPFSRKIVCSIRARFQPSIRPKESKIFFPLIGRLELVREHQIREDCAGVEMRREKESAPITYDLRVCYLDTLYKFYRCLIFRINIKQRYVLLLLKFLRRVNYFPVCVCVFFIRENNRAKQLESRVE